MKILTFSHWAVKDSPCLKAFILLPFAVFLSVISLHGQFTSTLLGGTTAYRDMPATETYYDTTAGTPAIASIIYRQTYNGQGWVTLQTQSEIYNGIEVLGNRITQAYDAQGRLVYILFEQNNLTSIDPVYKLEQSYDSNGEIIREANYFYQNGFWDPFQVYLYQNAYQGNVLVEVQRTDSLNPGPIQKTTNFYASTGELDSVLVERNSTGTYFPWRMTKYPAWYNYPSRKPSIEIDLLYNDNLQAFEQSSEMHYQYYSNDTLQQYITYYPSMNAPNAETDIRLFNQDGFVALDSSRYLVNFSPPTFETDSYRFFYTFDQQNRLSKRIIDSKNGNNPIFTEMYLYAYPATAIAGTISPSFQVYPNPASSNIRIDLQEKSDAPLEISLFDAAGGLRMKVLDASGEAFSDIQLSPQLENGIYFLQVKSAQGQATEKIVILR